MLAARKEEVVKIKKKDLPLCRAHHLPSWQAAIDERGHGAAKRWIFVPICRECRKVLARTIRQKLMTIVTARELVRMRNAAFIAAITAKAAATRALRRRQPAPNGVIIEALALIDDHVARGRERGPLLEDHPALSFRFQNPPV